MNDLAHLAQHNPEYLFMLQEQGLVGIDKSEMSQKLLKTRKFRSNVSPYLDVDNECGYVLVENVDKRYDMDEQDCRESILAGAYITYLSR